MHNKGIRRTLTMLGTATVAVATLAAPASAATDGSANGVTGKAATASTSVTVRGVTITATSDGRVKPRIEVASCGGRPNWVHLYTTAGDICFGYTGTASLSYNDSYGLCWGNNYGSATYQPLSNGDRDYYTITIDGWSGNATCPL